MIGPENFNPNSGEEWDEKIREEHKKELREAEEEGIPPAEEGADTEKAQEFKDADEEAKEIIDSLELDKTSDETLKAFIDYIKGESDSPADVELTPEQLKSIGLKNEAELKELQAELKEFNETMVSYIEKKNIPEDEKEQHKKNVLNGEYSDMIKMLYEDEESSQDNEEREYVKDLLHRLIDAKKKVEEIYRIVLQEARGATRDASRKEGDI